MIVHKKQNIRTALNFLTEDRMVGFCCIHVCLLFDCSMLLQYFPIKRQNPYMANMIISSIFRIQHFCDVYGCNISIVIDNIVIA